MPGKSSNEALKDEFAAWYALSKRDRQIHGLPETQKAFAEAKGVSPKTLRRWKKKDGWQARVDKHKTAPVEPKEPEYAGAEDPARAEFEAIRASLVEGAKNGDRTALKEYMSYFGKPFVEEELAARESEFSDLSDDELIEEMLAFVGADRVRQWLEEQDNE